MVGQSLIMASDKTLDGESIVVPGSGCRAPSDGSVDRRASLLRKLALVERERDELIEELQQMRADDPVINGNKSLIDARGGI